MAGQLAGKTIAILVTDGFEQSELVEPKRAAEEAGARTEIVSPTEGEVKGWKDKEWGDKFPVDVPLNTAVAKLFVLLMGAATTGVYLRNVTA